MFEHNGWEVVGYPPHGGLVADYNKADSAELVKPTIQALRAAYYAA